MNCSSFKIDYVIKENSVVILYFYDNAYFEFIPKIKDLISELKCQGFNKIILNLSDCYFIEKDIWEYFIKLKGELVKLNGDIIISNICGAVKNDYNLMELSNSIAVFKDIDNALYNFGIIVRSKYA